MQSVVFVTRRIPDAGLDKLARAGFRVEVNPEDRPLRREELLAGAREAAAVIGLLTDCIDAAFFDAAPNLRVYANYAVGFDNIDVNEATARGVAVCNTPDVLTTATAELALALTMAVARRVVEADALMRSGSWPGWGPLQLLGAELSGSRLGIVGAGRIGTALAKLFSGFGMDILYTTSSPSRPNPAMEELGARRASFDELVAEANVVSIHTPLTDATRHLFTAEVFARMKHTAILVNTARGPVIKEDDLVAALKAGEIAGAGLDVYEFEPETAKGLRELSNVVLLPHVGSATLTARNAMAELAADNVIAVLEGRRPPACLNPEVL